MNRLIAGLLLSTFFASGCAALIYQLVWQRYLFAGLGVDMDSVTIVVATFMLGIGLGGALGGYLADRHPTKRIVIYALAELTLGLIGLASPWLLSFLPHGQQLGWGYGTVTAFAMLALLIPTAIMGTTLPLLTVEFDDTYANVGVSVGMLYGANTFGAAFGAWLTSHVLFMSFGLQMSAYTAASMNLICFALALVALAVKRPGNGPVALSF